MLREREYTFSESELDDLLQRTYSEGYYDGCYEDQRQFGAVKQANKAAKKLWEVGEAGKYRVKDFRRWNSPMAMTNGTWAKDNGANKLMTKISTRDKGSLKSLSGRNQKMGPSGPIAGGGYI